MKQELYRICKGQYDAALAMLLEVIEVCPDGLWNLVQDGRPSLGQNIYHALSGSWVWFRNPELAFQEPPLGEAVAELKSLAEQALTKEEVREYAREVQARTEALFDRIGENLTGPFALYGKVSNLDIILSQVRHIQHHVGYCNHWLKEQGAAVAWRER